MFYCGKIWKNQILYLLIVEIVFLKLRNLSEKIWKKSKMSAAVSRQARGAAGVSRLLTKLKISLDTENFYEAHQIYRTIYFR